MPTFAGLGEVKDLTVGFFVIMIVLVPDKD
jgi:hypothetical protein